jgi:DNA-directed RNA polymerase subunit beta'
MSDELLVSGDAFKEIFKDLNPDARVESLKKSLPTIRSISGRDNVIKQIKYLSGLKKSGLKPTEAFILHNVPVIPPIIRPATVMGGNRIEFADVNDLYKDHFLVNEKLRDIKDDLPPEMVTAERAAAYNGVKAIMGLGDAISPASRNRGVGGLKGLVRQVSGMGSPKLGLFHNKILSKKQDFSGRATIYAEPNLEFNEAAIPEDMIWSTYKFHILRDLAKKGYDYINAEKAWTDRSPAAVASFNKMIKEVPMLLNRAPTLMKSNITGFYPIPTKGKTIGLNPLMLPMFAGDYDGDALTVHVPQTPEAVREAREKLVAKAQIHDYRKGLNNSIIAPGHEAIVGSMYMTEPDLNQEVVKFKTEAECLKALKEGKVKENTPVEITG